MSVELVGHTESSGHTIIQEDLLLDKVVEPSSFAYGVRKLRATYSGNAIRVRRFSDNAEQDIGFVGGELDEASLNSFIPVGTNGSISVWYDQSGNNVNATQSVAGRQPKISTDGVIFKVNGKPALDFSSFSNVHMINSISQPVPYSTSFITKINDTVSTSVLKGTRTTREEIQYSAVNTLFAYDGSVRAINDPGGYVFNQLNTYLEEWKLGGTGSIYINNFTREDFVIGNTNTPTGFVIGNTNLVSQNLRGSMNEFIGFTGVLSESSRTLLLANQINYYGIT